jgi:hypothetical protein
LTHAVSGRYTRRVPPKRITSAVYAVFTLVAGAFVISSTYQLAAGVFTEPASPTAAPVVALGPACASGIQSLAGAVERGVAAAAAASTRAEAERRYQAARSPEWDHPRQHELILPCATEARGADAVAAVSRLDRAAEGAIRRQSDELAPVRRAVDSFIR